MRFVILFLFALLLPHLLVGCASRQQSHPITYWNGSPWTQASVNGVLGTFLIDTGASMSVLDSDFSRRADVRSDGTKRIIATTGEVILATGWARSIEFLGEDHEDRYVSIQDLSTFRAPGGIRQSGLIGTDLLLGYTLILEMEHATARLKKGSEPPMKQGLVGFPFEMIDGIPTIEVAFGSGPTPYRTKGRIDTGSGYADESMLHLDMSIGLARKVLGDRMSRPPDDMTMIRSLSGVMPIALYDHGPVRLLGQEFTNARIAVHEHGEGLFKDDILLISGNLLAQFPHVEIDFPRRRIRVDPLRPVLP